MKNHYIVFILIALSINSSASTYSLKQLLEMGLNNSQEMKIAETERKKSHLQYLQAIGGVLPTVSLNSDFQNILQDGSPMTQMANELKQNMPNAAFSMPTKTLSVGASFSQPIFMQGKNFIKITKAMHYREFVDERFQFVQDSIKATIIKLFYTALMAYKNRDIQAEAAKLSAQSHHLSIVRVTSGNGNVIDTLTSRMNLEKTRFDSTQAESNKNLALEALANQVGLPDKLEGISLEGDFSMEDFQLSLNDAMVRLHEQNRVLKQLLINIRISEDVARDAFSDMLPTIYLGTIYDKISQANSLDKTGSSETWHSDQRFFINTSIDLFKGFRNTNKIREARVGVSNQQQAYELAERTLSLAVKRAWTELDNSKNEMSMVKSIVNLAQRSYEAIKTEYGLGVKTFFEMKTAELDLMSAKISESNAQLGYCNAVIDLKFLLNDL